MDNETAEVETIFFKIGELVELDAKAVTGALMAILFTYKTGDPEKPQEQVEVEASDELKRKWFALGNDGCNVLVGYKSGVGARLRNEESFVWLLQLHCACHRLALAAKDAHATAYV
jgi:hypothetical protein